MSHFADDSRSITFADSTAFGFSSVVTTSFCVGCTDLSGASGMEAINSTSRCSSYLNFLLSGRHPCLWCLVKSCDMKIPISSRAASTKHTVQGILDDHAKLMSEGGSDLRKAKEYSAAEQESKT